MDDIITFFSCPNPFRDGDGDENGAPLARFTAIVGNNNVSNGVSTLTNTFVNGANETGVTPVSGASLTAISAFFSNVTYIGAVRDAADTWWQGWTCGIGGGPAC